MNKIEAELWAKVYAAVLGARTQAYPGESTRNRDYALAEANLAVAEFRRTLDAS